MVQLPIIQLLSSGRKKGLNGWTFDKDEIDPNKKGTIDGFSDLRMKRGNGRRLFFLNNLGSFPPYLKKAHAFC